VLDPPGPGGLCPICLLKMGMDAGEGLDTSGAPTSAAAAPGAVPAVIGPYHLLQVIGEGGMGLVYLAEQREPLVRRVALKLIKPGMDTREVLARFEAERQALALMDHPNIARVLDAGLGPGDRPYFVMEYVAGIPITDYCDRHRLRNAERLQIFLQVCAALQHAHQKGIIHRDIKPSNILVTVQDGKPVPKVIDFGIAKATRQGSLERAAFTQLGMLIGTPEYISPEQAEASGLEVDTTTDIYSLGVVLYELLTGVLPFDGETLRRAGYVEMHRIIREQDPPKPSLRVTALGATAADVARQHQTTMPALGKQLRGDLDAIAMKAMEKDRTRRYASASEFAADITRYLNGEPVVASPPSMLYRTRKFVRRHRLGAAAATIVIAALVVGLALSTVFYVKSEHAREQAEEQAYSATIAAADSLAGIGHPDIALDRLLQAPRSGWEWWHLFLKSDTSLVSLNAWGSFNEFPYAGSSFAFSADGQRVYFNTETTLHEWDVNTYAAGPTRGGFGDILALGPGASFIVSRPVSRAGHLLTVVAPASGRVVATLTGHTAPVECAAVSRDGTQIASGGEDGTVRTWDTATGRMLAVIRSAAPEPCPVTFSPDQRLVAFGGQRAVQISETVSGRSVSVLQGGDMDVSAIAFSHDGTRLAAGSYDRLIRTWHVPAGTPAATMWGHRAQIITVAFSPDDRQLASGAGDGTARLWDVASGRQAGTCTFPSGDTVSVAFEPQGSKLFVAGGEHFLGATIRVWDRRAVDPWRTLPHDEFVHAVAFSRDGSQVATGSDGTIRLWDASTGGLTAVLSGHTGPVNAIAYHPSESRMASASDDKTVRLWDARAGRLLATIQANRDAVNAVSFSPVGTEVASAASDGLVLVCDALSGQVLAQLQSPEQAQSLAWDQTGTRLVIGFGDRSSTTDGRVRLWDWKTGTVLASVEMPGRSAVSSIAVSPIDGRIVVAGSAVGNPQFWDSTLTRQVATLRPADSGAQLAFFPDGRRLASASRGGMVRIWDTLTLKPLLNLEVPGVYSASLAVSPDGRRVAAAVGKDVRVWSSVSAYHPDASGLVDRLFEELEFADAVSVRIRGDDGLDPKLREAALRMVQSRGDQPARLNSAAWKVAKSPDHDGAAYTLAVRRAERAAQVLPWDPEIVNTLGVAQYRAGEWKAALATLERAAAMRERPSTADLTFLAMAHQRLGDVDAARIALGKLRAEMARPYNAKSAELQALQREAEALIAGGGAKPAASPR
jgi:WD40 repeat protein/serine/threonine protein kinase